jgi:hypothetical protein
MCIAVYALKYIYLSRLIEFLAKERLKFVAPRKYNVHNP